MDLFKTVGKNGFIEPFQNIKDLIYVFFYLLIYLFFGLRSGLPHVMMED